jgi:uncharacterized protein YbgA (DUF1722 family)
LSKPPTVIFVINYIAGTASLKKKIPCKYHFQSESKYLHGINIIKHNPYYFQRRLLSAVRLILTQNIHLYKFNRSGLKSLLAALPTVGVKTSKAEYSYITKGISFFIIFES